MPAVETEMMMLRARGVSICRNERLLIDYFEEEGQGCVIADACARTQINWLLAHQEAQLEFLWQQDDCGQGMNCHNFYILESQSLL